MTMVIITGGIDLSVGSLAALSAVLATLLIRGAAGGEQASAAGMVLCCLAAIAACGLVGLSSGVLITAFRLLLTRVRPLRARDPPRPLVWRAFVVAGFAGLVFHTLGYAAFLEDPIAWTLLAVGIVLAGEALPAPEHAASAVEPAPAAASSAG